MTEEDFVDPNPEEVQVTLDVAVAKYLENGMNVRDHDDSVAGEHNRFCPTGQEYIQFCSDGIKREGDKIKLFFTCPTALVDSYIKSVMTYRQTIQNAKNLYWRIRPEVDCVMASYEDNNGLVHLVLWKIYSRLVIT